MGQICSGDNKNDPDGGGPAISKPDGPKSKTMVEKKLRVYGNAFNSDTRTILTLLEISGVKFNYVEIDIFQGKHQEEEYLSKNPCGTIPMIIDNDCVLMGKTNIFVNYLTTEKPKLQSYRPLEHAAKIDQYMSWFLTVMQPCVSNLIKVLIGPKAFCHDIYSGEDVEAAKEAFIGDICKRVEKMLENRQFLIANNEPTVIDIIFYNEMSTSLMIMRIKGFKRMFPRIEQWVPLWEKSKS